MDNYSKCQMVHIVPHFYMKAILLVFFECNLPVRKGYLIHSQKIL